MLKNILKISIDIVGYSKTIITFVLLFNIKTTTMGTLKNCLIWGKMEDQGCFRNNSDFAKEEAKKFNQKVDELAEKVYQAYLLKGEKIAEERKLAYKNANYRTYHFYL